MASDCQICFSFCANTDLGSPMSLSSSSSSLPLYSYSVSSGEQRENRRRLTCVSLLNCSHVPQIPSKHFLLSTLHYNLTLQRKARWRTLARSHFIQTELGGKTDLFSARDTAAVSTALRHSTSTTEQTNALRCRSPDAANLIVTDAARSVSPSLRRSVR